MYLGRAATVLLTRGEALPNLPARVRRAAPSLFLCRQPLTLVLYLQFQAQSQLQGSDLTCSSRTYTEKGEALGYEAQHIKGYHGEIQFISTESNSQYTKVLQKFLENVILFIFCAIFS